MAQTGYVPISLYYSTTAATAPTAANLISGELAINITDGILFYKDNAGVVQTLASKAAASGSYTSITLTGGTANGVAYLNASKVLTTGTALTFDGTTLSVVPDANRSLKLQSYGTYSMSLENPSANAGAAIQFKTNGNFIWTQGASDVATLTSTGLGIGTSSPGYKLDVSTNNPTRGIAAQLLNIASSGQTGVQLTFLQNNVDWWTIGQPAGTSAFAIWKSRSVGNDGTEIARFDSSGNLGLGVTPSAWNDGLAAARGLQVGSVSPYYVYSDGAGSAYIGTNAYYSLTGSPSWKYINAAAAAQYLMSGNQHQWLTAPSGTAGNAISFTQAMTLDASGNLGIGTTSPGYRLEVKGGTGTGIAYNDGTVINYLGTTGSNLGYLGTVTNHPVAFLTNATERARIDSSGRLLVGLTSGPTTVTVATPSTNSNLGVYSNSQITLSNPTTVGAYSQIAFGYNSGTSISNAAAAIGFISTSADTWGKGDLVFATRSVTTDTAPTERARIDSSGNLGLGVTPSAWQANTKAIDIGSGSAIWNPGSDTQTQILTNAYNNGTNFIFKGTGSASRYRMTGGQHEWYSSTASGTAGNAITFTQAMTLDASGNLLVGNTTGAGKLYVETTSTTAASTKTVATSTSYTGTVLTVECSRDTSNATYYLIKGSRTGVADVFRVADSGNVTNTNGSYGTISDAKMKTDIVDAGSQWSDIKAIRFRKFKMKDDPEQQVQLGVVAQELEQTSPGLVEEHTDRDAEGNDLGTVTKSVKTSILLMKAAVALQEAMARIEQLEIRVAQLEGK